MRKTFLKTITDFEFSVFNRYPNFDFDILVIQESFA